MVALYPFNQRYTFPLHSTTSADESLALCVRGLDKGNHIYPSPQDRLKQALLRGRRSFYRKFWALHASSLNIKRGEAFGIIGANGSGKSTLLQIIAGILTSTSGVSKVSGWVAAFLELGSGFNPDFSGWEKVFLNATILSLSNEEMEQRYDEIAAIAAIGPIGPFIEQPVKTHSSGMRLRLAIAVAIHVDADIPNVDETLVVRDEAFQRTCFSRIEAFQRRGGTILFVSHAPAAIVELCNRAILLDRVEMPMDCVPKRVIATYHKQAYAKPAKAEKIRQSLRDEAVGIAAHPDKCQLKADPDLDVAKESEFFNPDMKPESTVYYEPRGAHNVDTHVFTSDGRQVNGLVARERYVFSFRVKFDRDIYRIQFGMLLKTLSGLELGGAESSINGEDVPFAAAGKEVQVAISFQCLLLYGTYFLDASVLELVDEEVIFLDRHVGTMMFKVRGLEDSIATEKVDFCISADMTTVSSERQYV